MINPLNHLFSIHTSSPGMKTYEEKIQLNVQQSPLFLKDGFFSSKTSGKTRTRDKYRVVYSDVQRNELELEFRGAKYITIRRKSELAASLGLSERQVWMSHQSLDV